MYDTIIIGSGPAGLSAAVYAQRAALRFIVVEKEPFGAGQISRAVQVDNYPGLYGESGYALGEKLRSHAKTLGTEFMEGEAAEIKKEKGVFLSILKNGTVLKSRTVVYAAGASPRKLGIPGEQELLGKGVSYCAACDGAFFKGKAVAVIGGGDTALSEALILAKQAEKVFLLHRRESFRASAALQMKVREERKIQTITGAVPEKITGEKSVCSLCYIKDEKNVQLPVDGIFVAVGIVPNTKAARSAAALDPNGFIIADESGRTSAEGFFAAGDARVKRLRQIVTAAADGANCIASAQEYLALSDENPVSANARQRPATI